MNARAWRVVEAQHIVSTRKLVDSDEEQRVLEELVDRAKPPAAWNPELDRLHYLLATPFRYPPLPHGSRFGTRLERGIWYGSRTRRTAFAETAYYRLLFLEGTAARLEPLMLDLTAFTARVRTRHALDLTKPPFDRHGALLASKTSYRDTQALGRAMREAGVRAFSFPSARDVKGGVNVGVFVPRALATSRPETLETWLAVVSRSVVEMSRKDFFEQKSFRFPREDFIVRGELPSPAV